MNVKRSLAYGAMAAAIALTGILAKPALVNAQGGPEMPKAFVFGLANPCSTTDYTSIAATALGITPTELRVALVSGKTLEDLATEKGVAIDDVNKAVDDARQADVEQAQKDGTVPTFDAQPALPANETKPDIVTPGGNAIVIRAAGRWGGMGIAAHNEVNMLTVAADAIGVSCPDLVKAASSGKSIVQVATEKNVQVQTVIDAIVKARKDALAKDVAEGLITEAQATGSSVRLVEQVTQMISQPGGLMMWFSDFGGFGGGFRFEYRGGDSGTTKPSRPGTRPNRPGTDKAPDAPDAPPADATPEATPNA